MGYCNEIIFLTKYIKESRVPQFVEILFGLSVNFASAYGLNSIYSYILLYTFCNLFTMVFF